MKAHIFLTKPYILIFLILFFSLTTCLERTKAETGNWKYRGALCAFENPSSIVRAKALRKLIDLNYMKEFPDKKIRDLIDLLKNEYPPEVRLAAVEALGAMGEAAAVHDFEVVLRLVDKLKDEDDKVSSAAAEALGKMKMTAAGEVSNIAKLLDDQENNIVVAALKALRAIGKAAAALTPKITQLIEDEDYSISLAARNALDTMGDVGPGEVTGETDGVGGSSGVSAARPASEIAKGLNSPDKETRLTAIYDLQALRAGAAEYAPAIAELLNSGEDSDMQYAALNALDSMGDAADAQASKIVERLKNGDFLVRNNAAIVLGNMKSQAPKIGELLKGEKDDVIYYALIALENMGKAAAGQASAIANLLENPNIELRTKAVGALGAMQDAAAAYASEIAVQLDEDDRNLRLAALEALGAMGQAAAEQFSLESIETLGAELSLTKKIEEMLAHRDWMTRSKALTVLGAMEDSSAELIQTIAKMIADYDEDVRVAAVEVLESKGRLEEKRDILLILNGQYKIPQFADTLTFYAYYFAGGDEKINTLIKWLTIEPNQNEYNEQGLEMEIFLDAWDPETLHKEVLEKLANCISHLAREVKWEKSDQEILKRAEKKLSGFNFRDQADVVKNKIEEIEGNQVLKKSVLIVLGIVGGHVLFWITLIGLYPNSLRVQSIFFWNSWPRRILGFGYVGIILSCVPYFRTKLFAPFKDSLISSAALDTFDEQTYFDKSKVRDEASGQIRPLKEVITEIKNQIYLEGESGLGKTMFLRYLIRHSRRTAIYLRADNCSKGVIEAIQSKLHGPAQDPGFLKSLIHTGAIDICIDGLNEVSPDTRAHITEFVQNYPKANIIIASQPLEWIPPSTLKTYILQPLEEKQIETFLLTRKQSLPPDASVTGKDLEQACMNFLSDILNDELPVERIASAKRVLSNPIDLTLVALMLAYGQYPDLFHLMEQQFDLMNNDYKRLYNSDFPLIAFSEMVFRMRLDDKIALYQKEYLNEIKSMEKHKMVLSRSIMDAQEKISTQWYFRHDKIMDYFITCTFLGPNNIRLVKYIDDPRFRGVYFLLAILLPWEEAEALRERLIQYSAATKDHTVSDTFIQLLISRKAA